MCLRNSSDFGHDKHPDRPCMAFQFVVVYFPFSDSLAKLHPMACSVHALGRTADHYG
jgi:hypothetical protein